MGREDWYRRESWTEDDRAEFASRLGRSRGPGKKAQYLLIQGWTLLGVGGRELAPAALALVDQMLREFPERFFLTDAHYLRAQCLGVLDHTEEAISAYRQALDAQRAFPSLQTLSYLDFAWLVVDRELWDMCDEALQILDEFGRTGELFPVHAYRTAGARALLWARKGDNERARRFAREALAAAELHESPLRYHRALGVVKDPDPNIHQKLRALAAEPADEAVDPAAGTS